MQYEQLERESSKYTERIQRLEQLLQERSVRTAAIESEAVSLVQVRYRLTDRQRDSQTVSQTVSQTDRQTHTDTHRHNDGGLKNLPDATTDDVSPFAERRLLLPVPD